MTYEFPQKTAIFTALATMLITLLPLTAASAQSAVDADFQRYCRDRFSNSVYERRAESWGVEHYCNQGGTRQNIDLAEACYLTTGSRKYEVSGARVLCDGSPDDAPAANANDLGPPDFGRYCKQHFPNSVYEKRAEPRGIAHYCRRPGATGGFTLQPVSPSAACQISHGTPQFRIDGAQVFCTAESASSSSHPGPGPAPGPVPRPRPAPGPAPGPLPDPGSGPASPPSSIAPSSERSPQVLQPFLSAPGTGHDPCRYLGGKWPSLWLGGKWRSGTLALVNEINATYSRDERSMGVFQAYMEINQIYQCHLLFFNFPENKTVEDINLAVKEACAIRPVLDGLVQELTVNSP